MLNRKVHGLVANFLTKDDPATACDSREAEILQTGLEEPAYSDPQRLRQSRYLDAPLTPRIHAVFDEAIRLADEGSRAEFGLSLASRVLLQYVEEKRVPVYSLSSPENTPPFRRRWPHCFRRIKAKPYLSWQPYNGNGKPIGSPWQFKSYDLLLLPAGTWQYAGEDTCYLYDDRGTDDAYWRRLARVIDETTHPMRCVRSLLWPRRGPPPPLRP